ncbi:Bug family tripartite tricarboxylate transporter substrate binding protein [Achromobacter aloeverae]
MHKPHPPARRLPRALCALALLAAAPLAQAQAAYPDHKVRVIAPQGAGGGVDIMARSLAEELSKRLGQTFYVDNQGGAGGTIGATDTARAKPDGYTLMVAYVATHGTNPAVRKTPYDPVKSFTPVAMIGGTANVLLASTALPAKTLPEFVAYAKAHGDTLSYGTSGNGTLNHLAMEEFKSEAGFKDLSVPYKSMAEAQTDMIGGRVQSVFPGVAAGLAVIKSGKARPLAVTGDKRNPVIPDVPTFAEQGYPKMQALTWYGVVGPAGMPAAVTTKLNQTVNDILKSDGFRERLRNLGVDPMPMTPRQFGDYIAHDIETWKRVARENHISLD